MTTECKGVTLRLNFPSFRQGAATIHDLVETIYLFLPQFCLPRSTLEEVRAQYGKISAEDYELKWSQLSESARDLFKRANIKTNRNGEAGELLLHLLTDWILGAPQLIAKMSLKTNTEMPVHGADGVHVKYCHDTSQLMLYWGESKLYKDVGSALTAAITSITESLQPEKLKYELELVQRNISFSGLDDIGRAAVLSYLDPFDEASNQRNNIITCLIGFDFDGFKKISAADGNDAEAKFTSLAKDELSKLAPKLADAVNTAGLAAQPIELFLFPVPSVAEFRDFFQSKIGWPP
ncbi:DUF1837 domain-containing protein [Asticcacaulis sp. SL142]|uniref:HamA C-terminal domain-containing protein n=1 Tax=Asticcacaulis sp. SL142 TaxID=2995155 RepID=UPI00226D0F39|nr:DUF1837 domain-containing protein [Asticcacaulis sp. SL142]WAC49805.1 DUF1837 domain-containing protein [Asticcacaulis sp. SL142]